MGILERWFGSLKVNQPKAAVQSASGGISITTPAELEEALRSGSLSQSGARVTADTAMRVGAVFACNRIIAGAVATMPSDVKRRVDDRTRESASDHPLWKVVKRRPNRWQTPSQFKRMMQSHVNLRGNAYALIVRSRGAVQELIPLDPDRMEVKQNDDLTISYKYTTRSGARQNLNQAEVFHLTGLTLDGVNGVSVITYARETIGASLTMEKHGSNVFKNGAQVNGVLSHPKTVGQQGLQNIRESLDEFRSDGEKAGKILIVEEGLSYQQLSMTSEDAQWIESRKFSKSDIAMFFGVPPHMIGDTEKSTSWGTGIEQQSIGFVTYTLEDHLTAWEETFARDCLNENESDIYVRFNRAALVKGDIKTRWEAHVKGLQWGVYSPNEIRALEDNNPREGGDIYYDPPNTAGGEKEETGNEPKEPTEN